MTRYLIFLLLLPIMACTSLTDRTRSIVTQVRDKHLADRRTELFSVEVLAGGENTIILKGETTLPQAKDELLRAISEKKVETIDSIAVLPDTLSDSRFFGLVTISVANLRREPDHSSELVSQSLLGTPVMILKKQGYWMLIRTPDRYISWTESSSVRPLGRHELREWNGPARMVFTHNTGWIYTSTAENGVAADIVAGCIVAKTGESGDHARIFLPDGREGYVRKAFLTPFADLMNKPLIPENVIIRAESYTGIPYLWGGSSIKGADCSGFVQNVFFLNGILLQRDASQQALYGETIDVSKDFSSLKTGDLLFFGSPERITHVAIYRGDTEYIHSSGRVTTNSLDPNRNNYSQYRRSSLVKAVRITGSSGDGIVPVISHSWY